MKKYEKLFGRIILLFLCLSVVFSVSIRASSNDDECIIYTTESVIVETIADTEPTVEVTESFTEPVIMDTAPVIETTEPVIETQAPTIETPTQEYPVAHEIWSYMKTELGWNDSVCAGVMGNLMVETGGHTLNLHPTLYSSDHAFYGICQWSLEFCPETANTTLEQQCEFLKNTVQKEFNNFGKCYAKGFKYEDFIQLSDAEEVALAFAKCYERCAQTSYNYTSRQKCARIAYDYFVK